ncbi:MAG: 3-deoxy-7-phosphoheptulonate synthase [Treponema sp.]
MQDSRCASLYRQRIVHTEQLISPCAFRQKLPVSEAAYHTVSTSRKEIEAIIRGDDERFLLIIGPCSIHDPRAAYDYAKKLAVLRKKYEALFSIIMRVYVEKPRTCIGWRGLIVEPNLDGTSNRAVGLHQARALLLRITEQGLPAAAELLDPITPQYISDVLSWTSIGARSAESQLHREFASGLSMPVGFKNGTNGDIEGAVNAVIAARRPHTFLSIGDDGHAAVIHTAGNEHTHLVLRGGRRGTNYDRKTIETSCAGMTRNGIAPAVIVDCSHGNSQKNPENQQSVLLHTLMLRYGDKPIRAIRGCMLESFLHAGCTDIANAHKKEAYGVSITDPCMSWDMTETLLKKAAHIINI